jgi:hypothetical protein
MQRIGLGFVEVWSRHIEPKLTREALRDWRLSVLLDEYRKVAEKYRAAGIEIVALTFDMKEDFSVEELDRGFEMARALGTGRIATSTTFRVAERLLPLMEKYRIEVAFHGHANAADPNEFAGVRILFAKYCGCPPSPASIWISASLSQRVSTRFRSSGSSIGTFLSCMSVTAIHRRGRSWHGEQALLRFAKFCNC